LREGKSKKSGQLDAKRGTKSETRGSKKGLKVGRLYILKKREKEVTKGGKRKMGFFGVVSERWVL